MRAPEPKVHLEMERPEPVVDARLRIGNASKGGLVARSVEPLRSRFARFRMAAFRRLDREGALLLVPAQAVHTFGTWRASRVVFLDAGDRVVAERRLGPWRAIPAPPGARAALLLHGDNASRAAVGDQLEWLRSQPRLPERADWLADAGIS